jgi:pyridoxal phosphate enzyme (YggS family)
MTESHSDIASRLQAVRQRIQIAAAASGRKPEEIRLIAVSKTANCADIQRAIDAGQRAFGENTVQESLTREALMKDPSIEWHFIGHLQTNKVRHLPGRFTWVHTLDSLKLARKLSDHAEAADVVINTLLQINIADDPDKFGMQPDGVFTFVDQLLRSGLGGIRLCGLMTIGRYEASTSETRHTFARLRALRDACAQRFGAGMFRELSMGMSGDFEIAIAEGSTMVRVGSAIFGARPAARDAATPRRPE